MNPKRGLQNPCIVNNAYHGDKDVQNVIVSRNYGDGKNEDVQNTYRDDDKDRNFQKASIEIMRVIL